MLQAATALERYRIVELLIDQQVIRRDAFGTLVFHNEGFLYAKDIVGLEPIHERVPIKSETTAAGYDEFE
jgi:hypothetical protein